MEAKWRYAAVAAVAVALVGTACGGGGGGNKNASATATGSETASAKPTPFATPIIVGNNVTSLKGYTVTFPDGWRPRPNFINTSDATVDAYFEQLAGAPQPGDVQANISVTCEVERGSSPEQFLSDAQTTTARLPQNKGIQTSTRPIAGKNATVIAYRFESAQDPTAPKLDKQDIIFSNEKCDWTITTTVPEGQYDKYRAQIDGFLNSFKLT
jgi:hypothetical protein